MITVGDKQKFAVIVEISEILQGWLLGQFAFVFRGRLCGNWNDAADLRGCHSWMRDFAVSPTNRFEPGLMNLTPSEIVHDLVRPVMRSASDPAVPEKYIDTYSRFHISHLGMSSFDRFRLVLIEDAKFQRCIWQDLSNEEIIYDDPFPRGHMQAVAGVFCKEFELQLASMNIDLKFNPDNTAENRRF